MATVAFFTQSTLVDVVLAMTVDTARFGFAKRLGAMALRATDHIMQTKERKDRQVMIEIDLAAPILLGVASVASGMEIPPVRAGRAVAAVAIGRQLLGRRIRRMTGVAVQLGVYPHQRKSGLRQMIIGDGPPCLVVVAIPALGAEALRV